MVSRRFVLGALPAVAVCSRLWSRKDHLVLTDGELTKNLVSAPGPTFRVVENSLKGGWTLIAYGDMRFTDPTNDKVTNPKVRRWLVERIGAEHPDALLLSGDVPYDGSVVNDYEVYRNETVAW
jgi:acid phosphatase type 7